MTGRAPAPARRRARGVSLLELVLVVMLIAVMSLLAAGALGGAFGGMQLRSSAKELAAQLRFARTRAIATGEVQTFAIDPVAHAWRGAGGRHGDIPDTLAVAFTGARQARPREGEGAILFFADGASTGGRVRLSRGQAAWVIDVAWLTGEVRVQREAGAQ